MILECLVHLIYLYLCKPYVDLPMMNSDSDIEEYTLSTPHPRILHYKQYVSYELFI